MEEAENDIDKSTSFATFRSFDVFEISQDWQSLFDLSVDDHVKELSANQSDGSWSQLRLGEIIESKLSQEEQRYQELHSEYDKALLQSKTLL